MGNGKRPKESWKGAKGKTTIISRMAPECEGGYHGAQTRYAWSHTHPSVNGMSYTYMRTCICIMQMLMHKQTDD